MSQHCLSSTRRVETDFQKLLLSCAVEAADHCKFCAATLLQILLQMLVRFSGQCVSKRVSKEVWIIATALDRWTCLRQIQMLQKVSHILHSQFPSKRGIANMIVRTDRVLWWLLNGKWGDSSFICCQKWLKSKQHNLKAISKIASLDNCSALKSFECCCQRCWDCVSACKTCHSL